MKCAACGADNPDSMKFCGMCGKPTAALVVSPGEPRNRYCVTCGRTIAWDVGVCQYCGHDYRTPTEDVTKDYVVVGGVLTMIAGVLSIVLMTIMISSMGNIDEQGVAMAALLYSCAVLGIMGGLLAMMRKAFPIAVLGAACAIMGPAFFFGIPGLALIVKSSGQFRTARGAQR